ncbi:MAG: hypothetical protein GYB25_12125 [Rhodobacteraceae bacterium]|nr:hypothetical protein [Paracoccaceae bacterium]
MSDDITKVGPVDPDKRTSDIVQEESSESERAICYYNGVKFSTGARVCGANRVLLCQGNGTWYRTNTAC